MGHEENKDKFILVEDDLDKLPIWPFDVSIATLVGSDIGWPDGTWQFMRARALNKKEWRGRIKKFFPKMIELAYSFRKQNGTFTSCKIPFSIVNGKLIQAYGTGGNIAECGRTIKICAGFALNKRYDWSVLLHEDNTPSVRLLTDIRGCREIFKLRDAPPGKLRRAALIHWVTAHWRKKRQAGASDRKWVKEFLRGKRSFTWNGLHCTIELPEYDQEQVVLKGIKA
ncbi:hypothetical protein [Acetobacter pasteurianus]|uniref:hypothetical protein n=1 Tax=Acetobacter TaxID=434 RepID=UPI000676BA76|nr:hypothetical protein [Acetobacter pasteurianus]AKR48606.1 hypothetical protein DB34_06490 [Acetobacter pasteurianus]